MDERKVGGLGVRGEVLEGGLRGIGQGCVNRVRYDKRMGW